MFITFYFGFVLYFFTICFVLIVLCLYKYCSYLGSSLVVVFIDSQLETAGKCAQFYVTIIVWFSLLFIYLLAPDYFLCLFSG